MSEDDFALWVPYCIKKKKCIIAMVNYVIKRCTHKDGVEAPTSVREKYDLVKKNWND